MNVYQFMNEFTNARNSHVTFITVLNDHVTAATRWRLDFQRRLHDAGGKGSRFWGGAAPSRRQTHVSRAAARRRTLFEGGHTKIPLKCSKHDPYDVYLRRPLS